MDRRAAHPPRQPGALSNLEHREISLLTHDGAYSESELAHVVLPNQDARGVSFESARLVDVEFAGSRLDDLRLSETILTGCNLANMEAQRAAMARVTVESSRLTGIRVPEATLRDVTIRDCRVDLGSFAFSQLTRVTFESCMLAQTDFLEAQLESVRFHHCDLTGADFRGARMQRCEFRRSDLNGIQGVESLRGSAMEWPDIVELAGTLAATLGIEVLDPN